MELFDKKKDFILKITNLVLLIWLIGSIVVFYVNMIDLFMPEPTMTFEEYRVNNCYYDKEGTTDENCQNNYDSYKIYDKSSSYNKKRVIFTSIGSIIIVVGALYFINYDRKRGVKK